MYQRIYTNRRFLDALAERVLVYDGAMGTSLQKMKLTVQQFGGERTNGCNDYLVISYPQAVEAVHRSFLAVGVDVIETDTFRANRLTLNDYGLADCVIEINHTAAALARQLADEYGNRFVAGSMGPSGKLPSAEDPELSNITFNELADVFREQAVGLIQGDVDVLLIETSQDILEVKAAITGCHRAFVETGVFLPIQAQVTLDTTGRMLLGTDIAAALAILEGLEIDVIGLNCSTGPEHMRQPVAYLGENASLPVSCIPNAGLPLNVDGEAVYPLEPEPFANTLMEFVEKNGIRIVGGCCGTTPDHLQLLVDKIKVHSLGITVPDRTPPTPIPCLASATRAVPMHQEPPPFLVGERCNAQGSKKFKKLILMEDYDAILEIAREQVEFGAHALDISTAVTERPDEVELMRKTVKKLASGVDVPLVIDTTEPEVLRSALETAPGRCLINSTHLEGGREKADRIFDLVKMFNAAVICLTIDESGMAKTADRKLDVARRIYDIAINEHGLRPDALVFDTLTFTLATGEAEYADSARETLEGIRQIKGALPGVLCSLGVSNLSFGLSANARPVLNSVMLYHAVQAGLDMAIVNPAHITPYADISPEERELAEDLIFNRRADALQRYIEHFESVTVETSRADLPADPTVKMSPAERLHWRILHRRKEGVEEDIDEIIASSITSPSTSVDIQERIPPSPFPFPHLGEGDNSGNLGVLGNEAAQNTQISEFSPRGEGKTRHEVAVQILNNILLPAMKEVGDKFGAGELILPFVLQSAEVMKKAVSHLENYLEKQEGISKGTIVLATVYGDVHDIGKNLVKTILANNGYTVVDLGKQVPAETIINKAVEVNASAIGLSALLVSTSKQMPLIVNELHRRGLKFPVLIGGAAINRRFGWRILYTEDGAPYEPGVFYCKDAFEGLGVMGALTEASRKEDLLTQLFADAAREVERNITPHTAVQNTHSSVKPVPLSPAPFSLGPKVVRSMPLELVFDCLSLNELYRLSWGAKNTHGVEWESLKAEFDTRLSRMKQDALRWGWLKPQAVYGYWSCQSDGNDLILYQPDSLHTNPPKPLVRFSYPRQSFDDHLCLADYFSPLDSGLMDLVAFQVVTVGLEATEQFDRLQAEGNYSEAYYLHGLAVQTAEATAEYLHRHIRRELRLSQDQGKRYSWGYPAIPYLDDHRKVFDLLPAEKELGMSLTAAFQLVPEQSTAAIIVHHPEAKYFNIGESRVGQLVKGMQDA